MNWTRWVAIALLAALVIFMLAFARGGTDGHRIGSLAGPTVPRPIVGLK